MSDELFTWACREIEGANDRLGHVLGWRFLNTPARTLALATPIAFISLNPGGDCIDPSHARESSEAGPAYIVEAWGHPPGRSPLQLQVRTLFEKLAQALNVPSGDALMNESLMSHYIPFRSPDLARLHRLRESRAFAFQLWSRLMHHIRPQLIICIDHVTFRDFRKILGTTHTQIDERRLPTGWGTVTATVNDYAAAGTYVTLTRLPHLSRFRMFNRRVSQAEIASIVKAMSMHVTRTH